MLLLAACSNIIFPVMQIWPARRDPGQEGGKRYPRRMEEIDPKKRRSNLTRWDKMCSNSGQREIGAKRKKGDQIWDASSRLDPWETGTRRSNPKDPRWNRRQGTRLIPTFSSARGDRSNLEKTLSLPPGQRQPRWRESLPSRTKRQKREESLSTYLPLALPLSSSSKKTNRA